MIYRISRFFCESLVWVSLCLYFLCPFPLLYSPHFVYVFFSVCFSLSNVFTAFDSLTIAKCSGPNSDVREPHTSPNTDVTVFLAGCPHARVARKKRGITAGGRAAQRAGEAVHQIRNLANFWWRFWRRRAQTRSGSAVRVGSVSVVFQAILTFLMKFERFRMILCRI